MITPAFQARQIRQLAQALNLGSHEYRLVRVGTNTVFENRADKTIARVAPSYISRQQVLDSLITCRELSAAGMPIIKPLLDDAVPLPNDQHVTFWPMAESSIDLDGHQLGNLLTVCHDLQSPIVLAHWTPDLFVDRRQATLERGIKSGLPITISDQLKSRFKQQLGHLKDFCDGADINEVIIHGDTDHSNFVRQAGKLLLCDPDNICRGPREKDLANILESCRRGRLKPELWDELTENYAATYDEQLLERLLNVQEIGSLLWLAQFWGLKPETRSKLVYCLETLDEATAPWPEL